MHHVKSHDGGGSTAAGECAFQTDYNAYQRWVQSANARYLYLVFWPLSINKISICWPTLKGSKGRRGQNQSYTVQIAAVCCCSNYLVIE